jgi:ASC-1-like (ASCH) protein
MEHSLKTLPVYFERVWNGEKTFEVRKNDRGFQAGDKVVLHEWTEGKGYTNRTIYATIRYVLTEFEGLAIGYVAFSIEVNSCVS